MKHVSHTNNNNNKKPTGRMLLRFSGVLKENHFQRKVLYFYSKKEIHNLFSKSVLYTYHNYILLHMYTHLLTQMHSIINIHIKI